MANIYTYTSAEGAVHLSNVPTDRRYTVLIESEKDKTANRPVADTPNPPSAIAAKFQYDRIVDETARTYGVESALLHAVISVESQYNPTAVSKKGAAGLMQLMPRTAKHYGVSNTLNPEQNIQGGARYLRDLLVAFNSDLNLTLAAYNAGETMVRKHGNRIPPIRETMNYVPRVLDFYRKYRAESSYRLQRANLAGRSAFPAI
ncbi:MAG: lytic transglycosylase domain-containing protein [Sulfuricella sp.]|nr:lytic transglycosylase domain-containing protein [Sulfuricella sp.]